MQDKVEASTFTPQAKKCSACGKIGHLAKDCRSKAPFKPANNRTAKVKAAEVEDIPIDDMEDNQEEDDDYEINASIFQTATSEDHPEVMPAEKRTAEREDDGQHGEILKKIKV